MHHYRCQNVYISSTARERIVDTLDFFPHNTPMPQLYSSSRLLMAANDMANALKHPHPEVPFTQVDDDSTTALAQLAAIFKNKFQRPSAPEPIQAPLGAAENTQQPALAQPILTSPMRHKYQTRSQRPISANTSRNTPLLPRVVTPMTGQAASLRVPAQKQNISPRNLSQHDFWNMETVNQEIALGANNWTKQYFTHALTWYQISIAATVATEIDQGTCFCPTLGCLLWSAVMVGVRGLPRFPQHISVPGQFDHAPPSVNAVKFLIHLFHCYFSQGP
jgi:hypothetical protein